MTNSDSTPEQQPPWLLATLQDLEQAALEAPVEGCKIADCGELSQLFRTATALSEPSQEPVTSEARVFALLGAITQMHFKPHERNEPFGPMMVLADGRRTAIPADFRAHVDVLGSAAERAVNPVLGARLADVTWILDKKKSSLALVAIKAYTEIVARVEAGELRFRLAETSDPLERDARDHLRRALQIARAIGWDKSECINAREQLSRLRKRALESGTAIQAYWFSELDLDFGVSDPLGIAKGLTVKLNGVNGTEAPHLLVDLWRLTARAFHLAKHDEDKNRCLAEAAETLVAEADQHASPMLKSHALSAAIAQMHGLPGKKERRVELRHKLIDAQAHISEELKTFSQEIDLTDLANRVSERVRGASLLDKLFVFAALARSPESADLVEEAKQTIRQHPLSSLFAATHLDREGKTIYRSSGAGIGDEADDSSVRRQIAQSEMLRRRVVVAGEIEAARHAINNRHHIHDDMLRVVLQHSPFIPDDLLMTFSRGFCRFFQGDFVASTYILIPLLENSLRYILRANGHDVTKFDDATQTQQDRTISSLYDSLRAELDSILGQALTADIERVFLEQPGPCLRHNVVHGLLHDGDPYGSDAIYGCWLIFRLCLLPLFPHRERIRTALAGSEFDEV